MASSLRSSCSQLWRSVPHSSAASSSSSSFVCPSFTPSSPALTAARRSFSSSPVALSHIGGEPITYPYACKLSTSTETDELVITGPLGIEKVPIKPYVRLFHTAPADAQAEGLLEVAIDDQRVKPQRMMWGTTRSLIANGIKGVTEGYRLPVRLIGVGFRAAVEDAPLPPSKKPEEWVNKKRLNLKLGFAHPVLLSIPDHVTVEVPIPTKLFISGTSLQLVTQFAANIRSHRPPEPYRGKVRPALLLQVSSRNALTPPFLLLLFRVSLCTSPSRRPRLSDRS